PLPLGKPGHRVRASRRRLSPLRTTLLVLLAMVMSSVAGGLAYFIPAAQLAIESTGQVIHVTPSPSTLLSPLPSTSPSATAVPVPGAFTVLLLGSDDDSKFIGDRVLTQSMILVRVVPSTKQVTMLSIPRDLWIPLSVGGVGKADFAYSYGGAGAAVATVEQDFQVHIDDYIWIGLLGLVKLIDALGGIDVVTGAPVLDDYYPADIYSSWPYDYERVAVLGGPQHLDGVHAMQYVRSRHGDLQSDLGRSQRQQQVLLAIRAKSKQVSPEDLPAISQALGGELKTSIGLSKVAQLLPLAASFDNPDNITQLTLGSPYSHSGAPDGSLTPNWGAILPLVHQYFT
ncbi:MAG TPA: LCP family protein, partial [Candidatus Udaeobacter sp.]|nr:LCP family protein [Candidatus Udaeobacter sp.]